MAEIMGPTFTEGGIVQHLAKLRSMMIANNIPVPPPIKRGTITKSPSKIYGGGANPRHQLQPIAPLFPDGTSSCRIKEEEDAEEPLSIYERQRIANSKLKVTTVDSRQEEEDAEPESVQEPIKTPVKSSAKSRGRSRGKGRGRRNSMSEDDMDDTDLGESESEYGSPKKHRRATAKSTRNTATVKTVAESFVLPVHIPADTGADDVAIKVEDEDLGPATRTRGVKRNYSLMAAQSSDEMEQEEVEDDQQLGGVTEANLGHLVEEHDAQVLVGSGSEDDEQQNSIASSEAETEILSHDDDGVAQTDGQTDRFEPAHVVNTPYGQVFATPQMAVSRFSR